MKRNPSHVRSELISQHDTLRGMMDQCEDLADSLDGHPDGDPTPLTRELARLRCLRRILGCVGHAA